MWACTCTIFNWLFSRTNKLNLHCEKRDFSLKKNLHTYLSSLVTFEDNIDKMGMFQYSNIQQWDTRYSSNTKWLMVFLIECKAMCLIRMICQGIRWKVEIVQTTLKWILWDSDQTIKPIQVSYDNQENKSILSKMGFYKERYWNIKLLKEIANYLAPFPVIIEILTIFFCYS